MHIFGKNKILALTALCAIVLQGCVKERKFVVDEGLLEKTATENNIGIDYQMPAGFSAIRQGMVDTIAVQEQQHDPFSGRIAAIYVDTLLGNSIVMITDMAAVPAERTENKLDFYFTEFNIGKTSAARWGDPEDMMGPSRTWSLKVLKEIRNKAKCRKVLRL